MRNDTFLTRSDRLGLNPRRIGMTYYNIQHVTRFEYDTAVRESIMEVRMAPRDEGPQSVASFELRTYPRAEVRRHLDSFGNEVHHFDIPASHVREMVIASAVVRVEQRPPLPEALPPSAWDELPLLLEDAEAWEMTRFSRFAEPSDLLESFAREIGGERLDDPLTTARELAQRIRTHLEYKPRMTTVDSPISEALAKRAGVCQDFAHLMLALCRRIGLPARYVSGYLAPGQGAPAGASEATHAWVEVLLPGLGWCGFDPTNETEVGNAHIRVAVGRDYADVPPIRGVYRGGTTSRMSVSVTTTQLPEPPSGLRSFAPSGWNPPEPPQEAHIVLEGPVPFDLHAQQMQQQQRLAGRRRR